MSVLLWKPHCCLHIGGSEIPECRWWPGSVSLGNSSWIGTPAGLSTPGSKPAAWWSSLHWPAKAVPGYTQPLPQRWNSENTAVTWEDIHVQSFNTVSPPVHALMLTACQGYTRFFLNTMWLAFLFSVLAALSLPCCTQAFSSLGALVSHCNGLSWVL